MADKTLVGINTQRAKLLVREALDAGLIEGLRAYPEIRAEVPFPGLGGRVDFRLRGPAGDYFLELKNVTAAVSALFPDTVSERASRHARALAELRRAGQGAGQGAGLLFCTQRADVQRVRPADEIDVVYGQELRAAAAAGGELMALRSTVSPKGISLSAPVTVEL